MPQPPNPSSPVDHVHSYARRDGDVVRVVLVLPDDLSSIAGDALTKRRVWLRLSHRVGDGREGLRVPVEVTPGPRPRLTAQVSVNDVPPDTWALALRIGQGGPLVRLEARLLTTDPARQPMALLVGPRPTTRLPEPSPR